MKFFLHESKQAFILGLLGVVLVLSFYNYLFAFSFLPITEGWFSAYAHLIINGEMPYRDFYLYLTPFYPTFLAGFIALFGDSFFGLRLLGVFIILGISILLYLILCKEFKPFPSMIATIVGVIYYQSGVAHIPYDFTQVLTLFAMLSLWMLFKSIEKKETIKIKSQKSKFCIDVYMLFAGLFASLAFMTKQSNGAFVLIGTGIACFYISFHYLKKIKGVFSFSLGVLIPILFFGFWLLNNNSLLIFWEQIFTSAISAKGNINSILFAWIKGLINPVLLVQVKTIFRYLFQLLICSLLIRIFLSLFKLKFKYKHYLQMSLMIAIISVIILTIKASFDESLSYHLDMVNLGLQINNYIISASLIAAGVALFFTILSSCILLFRKIISIYTATLFIVSSALIFGNGTSAGLSEISIFIILAYTIAWLMSQSYLKYAGIFAAFFISYALIFTFTSKKFDSPYAWWGITEPSVRSAHFASDLPIAKYLSLSKSTAEIYNILFNEFKQANKDESIFAFPHIPIVYIISNKYPNSKVLVSWFDFLPDPEAIKEAQRIKTTPPSIIAELIMPESIWVAHETLFRDSRPLGQREIKETINLLVKYNDGYQLLLEKKISKDIELKLWKRVSTDK